MDADMENDLKLFVQAFAEPTETYRLLKTHRKQNPPIFLNRNLTYANYKKCRPKKPKRRSSIKANSLLTTIEKLVEQKRGNQHYMTLTFSGFYCYDLSNAAKFAEVQIIHKETKAKLASIIIDVNPCDTVKGISVISLPTEALKMTSPNGKLLNVSTCSMLFRVKIMEEAPVNEYLSRHFGLAKNNRIFETDLELFDGNRNGLISSGNQLLDVVELVDLTKEISKSTHITWKLKYFNKKSLSLSALNHDEFEKEHAKPAMLKFHLQWSREISLENENKENGAGLNGSIGGNCRRRIFTRNRSMGSIVSRQSFSKSSDNIQCLVYQFIYKNYRQKTEFWDRLRCPWCSLKSVNLYILIKHLTLCHDRFKFIYIPGANETRIDVFLRKRTNDLKNDPLSRYGTKFEGHEPHKRKSMTLLLVFRPERNRPRLSEFLRSFDTDASGRKRTYYHSVTGLPLRPSEIDVNSEDELDPVWLRQNTVRLIDDFVDVNAGEKEIMKLWNLHLQKKAYVCDAQMTEALMSFVQTHAEDIMSRNLYRNFVLHICNLFDYGLISPQIHFQSVQILQGFLARNQSLRETVIQRTKQQCEHLQRRAQMVKSENNELKSKCRQCRLVVCKKRLRSHSNADNIQRNKIKKIEPLTELKKQFVFDMRRVVRKTTKLSIK